jgi:hypothetical protein
MHRIRGSLTYANVLVTILAVVVLGGGTAYAVTELPKESVGTKQLERGAVTPAKLSAAARTATIGRQGTAGPQGPQGAQGPAGATGPPAERGPAGPLLETLPSGVTMRGNYAVAGVAKEEFDRALEGITFQTPLASAPASHLIQMGAASTTECPGSTANPQAAPGNLCLYENRHENVRPGSDCASGGGSGSPCGTATRFGATVFIEAEGATSFFTEGTWAVTAP